MGQQVVSVSVGPRELNSAGASLSSTRVDTMTHVLAYRPDSVRMVSPTFKASK